MKYDIIVLASGPVVQLVRTLACHARGRRFDPVPDRLRTLSCERVQIFADIAQSAERVLGKDEVVSSSLIISSMKKHPKFFRVLFYVQLCEKKTGGVSF